MENFEFFGKFEFLEIFEIFENFEFSENLDFMENLDFLGKLKKKSFWGILIFLIFGKIRIFGKKIILGKF